MTAQTYGHDGLFAGLFSQFGCPRGLLGHLAGSMMALENKRANQLIVDSLELEPEDYVLEVGCGPGVAVERAARRAKLAIGVDPSTIMVAQARRRNRAAIRDGRAEIAAASADDLPFDDGFFTSAFGIHTVHHWPCAEDGLREFVRVLEPGGRVVLAERVQRPGRDPHAHGASEDELDAFGVLLTQVGFTSIRRIEHELKRETLAFFHARTLLS
jgi:ubiquinone/menaquinone biosynthesis C-methylase UbiE